ncbi:bis(5'-nucleosyl)-tetraphosphatase PrpE [asymmetrical]-like isoform X1 [Haliotis rubra]|uniref:bis(5'-nucleosyl)-tetraphosphatase PrpE [asymmetrical]-like isoform X1 n=2 Tax=Haliotis rubra TaxID=36100 RepID=UPI001EE524E3|nr:bis(5'-nucleosyl)-tetraphosphatase PrpE [asymmetrical]-like isoform X1 [Haliotis rubra]
MQRSLSPNMTDRKKGHERPSRYGLPLPEVCHLTLDKATIQDRAVFIIGDVHGCYDELTELMDKARTLENTVLFVFVGDLVNRGPKSKEVVKLLRRTDCYSVRGNHEETTLREHARLIKDPGYDLPERYQYIRKFDEGDLDYLKRLPYTICIPSLQAIIVHAGLEPGVVLEEQCLTAMTHMRSLVQRGATDTTLLPSNRISEGVPWASLWTGPEHVYYGHDKKRGYVEHGFATGLDTGCVNGEHLTGMFINGCRKTLTVPARKQYWADTP